MRNGQPINIGISEADRQTIVDGLSRLLADSYTLYLQTHNFHWNVTGPMFNTLHTMFMTQYTEQWGALDLIAERIRALGFPAQVPMPSMPGSRASRRSPGYRKRWKWCVFWSMPKRQRRARHARCSMWSRLPTISPQLI